MKPHRGWCVLGIVLFMLALAAVSHADDTSAICNDTTLELTNARRHILEAINQHRLKHNLFLYAPNPILCQIAQEHALLLSARSVAEISGLPKDRRFENNIYTSIDDWIKSTRYQPYDRGLYAVALYAFVSQLDGPDEVFNQMRRDGLMLSNRYREIGLGYVYQPTLDVYIYVLVFGSQPNTLTPMAVNPAAPYQQTQTFTTGRIMLSVPDERAYPGGNTRQIGNLLYLNVSQTPPPDAAAFTVCTLTETDRLPYGNFLNYDVQGAAGDHTVYVRMCDALGRMIVTQVDVTTGTTPPADIIQQPANNPAADIALVSSEQPASINQASIVSFDTLPLLVLGIGLLILFSIGWRLKRRLTRSTAPVSPQRLVNTRPTVFISYRRWVGWSAARNVHDSLTRRGADAFIDVDDIPAGVFDQYLTENIDQRDYFLVVLAPTTLVSEWVVKEIMHAHQQRKPIIPILVDRFDLYGADMPDELKFLQTYNAVTLSPEYFQAAIDKIATFIGLRPADIYGF